MPEQPDRVLLIQLRRVGDVVVSTALLEDLHRSFPGVICDWLAADAASLLEHHPLLVRVYTFDSRDAVGMSRAARSGGYDWVIDVQGSWRTAIATAASRAPVRPGWAGWNRGWAYTHRVPRAPRDSRTYVVRDRQRLLTAAGVAVGDSAPRLYLSEHERARGQRRIRQLASDRPAVGMVLSTSDPAKDWPAERFAEVAAALEREGIACVAFHTPGADRQIEAYGAALGERAVIDRLYQLRVLMERVAACDAFISGDTGPAHIATALGIPRVTVYGPTPAEGWTPPGGNAVAVRDESASCLSCAGRARHAAHSCLHSVTAEAVLTPIRRLLQRPHGREPDPGSYPSLNQHSAISNQQSAIGNRQSNPDLE